MGKVVLEKIIFTVITIFDRFRLKHRGKMNKRFFESLRKLNGKTLHATAPVYVGDDITIADCKDLNRKEDSFQSCAQQPEVAVKTRADTQAG